MKSNVLLKISNFEKALNRLNEAVKRAKDDLDKDGVIQRFEFSIELLWKSLKAILNYLGIDCYSPRSCIKEAFRAFAIVNNFSLIVSKFSSSSCLQF
jgi:nucleotidyltransferase substrate binding protein (TIGR01987 family)